jgi:hypothetical protein
MGLTTTLRFSATGATACTLDGVTVETNGTRDVVARDTVTHTFSCTGPGGSDDAAVTVTVPPCAKQCLFNVDAPSGDCTGGALPTDGFGLHQLDIGPTEAGVYLEVEVCNPTDFSFVLSDSATSDGFGGDANPGATCFDTELQLNDTTVEVFRNDFFPPEDRLAFRQNGAVATTGCSTLRVAVEDRLLSVNAPEQAPLSDDDGLFRLSPSAPCTDSQLGGDRRFFMAFERTPLSRADRVGDGLTSVFLCIR